jgi:signal transduction histidine kinase
MSTNLENERILILAPLGRDAPLLQKVLVQAALVCQVVDSSLELRLALQQETGALLLTEEALIPSTLHVLEEALAGQPAWSNLPLVMLVGAKNVPILGRAMMQTFGPQSRFTILERPVAPRTLVALMQANIWMRRRQYEVRSLLANLAIQNQALACEVAQRHDAEQALRELNRTLEQRVGERTMELEERNRELDQFVYTASHDLRSPLRAIHHLAAWIHQDAGEILPDASQVHLAKLQGRILRLERMLDDLLAYSRAGRQRHPPAWVDLAELVQETIELLAPSPGMAIGVFNRPGLVYTERVPLEIVLRNLIGNAIKHHDRPADGRITIALEEDAQWLVFSVTDDGPGIDPAFHLRIFQLFQTLRPRDEVEGSGMGLALVKKTVESRGGQVELASAVGQGATFRFRWPKAAVESTKRP